MKCSKTISTSPLTNDFLFLAFAIVVTIVYALSSSLLSVGGTRKHDSKQYHHSNKTTGTNKLSPISVLRQEVTHLTDTVTLVALPDQPDRMVLLVLSIVASNIGISQPLNNAIITCLSNTSETEMANWGAFGLERFTPTLVQVEYFVLASEQGSLQVPEKVDGFIRDGKLTECVAASNAGLPENANLLEGRTVVATKIGSIVSSDGKAPGWVIGVVIGCIVGIGFIALIVIWCKGEKVYKEEDYDKYEDDDSIDEGDMSESEDEELQRNDTIAGQDRPGIVIHL